MACGSEGSDTQGGGDTTKFTDSSHALASMSWGACGRRSGRQVTCSRQDLGLGPALKPLPSHLSSEPRTRKIMESPCLTQATAPPDQEPGLLKVAVGIVCTHVFTSSWPARVITGGRRRGGHPRYSQAEQHGPVCGWAPFHSSLLPQLPGMFLISLWMYLALMGGKRLVKQQPFK